jgi:hypothetical protein
VVSGLRDPASSTNDGVPVLICPDGNFDTRPSFRPNRCSWGCVNHRNKDRKKKEARGSQSSGVQLFPRLRAACRIQPGGPCAALPHRAAEGRCSLPTLESNEACFLLKLTPSLPRHGQSSSRQPAWRLTHQLGTPMRRCCTHTGSRTQWAHDQTGGAALRFYDGSVKKGPPVPKPAAADHNPANSRRRRLGAHTSFTESVPSCATFVGYTCKRGSRQVRTQ